MTFLELLLLIEERKEKTLTHTVEYVITDKHRYLHLGANDWQQDKEPGMPEQRHGKGGAYYVWRAAADVSADVVAFVQKIQAKSEEV